MSRREKKKMSKRKKISIGLILIILVVGGFIVIRNLGKGNDAKNITSLDNKIEYFDVEDVDQVFVNGIVTPVRSKEFTKDTTLGKLGDLQVKNGDVVDEGTILYQYVDDATSSQITDLKFQIEQTQAEKDKAARKMQLAINQIGAASEASKNTDSEEETVSAPGSSRESIELDYDLASFDMKMNQLQSQINELNEKQVNQVTAPFKGQVTIPQEQNRDSAILTLTSNDFYVEGEVNERDLVKLKAKQQADVRTISDNKLYKGEITYISNTPTSKAQSTEAGASMGGGSSSLSNYIVKMTLKDAKDIRDGFHVQASVKLEDKKIQLPKKALKNDKTGDYVLVDDFGSVVRKDIKITTEGAKKDHVVVISGLDALDKVIISSEVDYKNGDIIDDITVDSGGMEESK
ncbi:efflux RND transporter periplasmic adaptor subunit [Vagococcus sp.]|uniref:efflux RND transporter periplasmic adaptor subunit n=1 Tax=Vagococcus sp. TaxID=1933889 RepID=UPI003F96D6D1